MARLLSSIFKVFVSSYTAQATQGLINLSLSLILRRHNPIPWTAKLDDYLADLERIKAASTDEFLCRLVATERLCHDIDQELFLSDPVRSVSARDPKTLMIIQEFQSRNDWPPLAQLHSLQKCELLQKLQSMMAWNVED